MEARSTAALAASGLAGLAGVIAGLDGDADIVPFFIGLTFLGGMGAWAVHEPYHDRRRWLGRAIATLWLAAALIVGGLLLWHQALCGCSFPVRPPEATYLGLPATAYHVVGVFLGGALMIVAACGRSLRPT